MILYNKDNSTTERVLSRFLFQDILYRDLSALEQRLSLPVTQSSQNRGESTPCNTLKSTSSLESLFRAQLETELSQESRSIIGMAPRGTRCDELPVTTPDSLFENTWTCYEEKSRYLTLSLVLCLARLCFSSSTTQHCLLRNVFSSYSENKG